MEAIVYFYEKAKYYYFHNFHCVYILGVFKTIDFNTLQTLVDCPKFQSTTIICFNYHHNLLDYLIYIKRTGVPFTHDNDLISEWQYRFLRNRFIGSLLIHATIIRQRALQNNGEAVDVSINDLFESFLFIVYSLV